MSGDDERNIAPSPRRQAEARRAGLAPISHRLTAAVATGSGLLTLAALGDDLWYSISESLRSAWSAPVMRFDAADLRDGWGIWQKVALLVAVVLCVPMLAAAMTSGLQSGFRLRFPIAGAGWRATNPRTGLRRMAGGLHVSAIGGLAAGFACVCLLTGWEICLSGSGYEGGNAESAAGALGRRLISLGIMLGVFFLLTGVGDWIVSRRRFQRRLRMTIGEARDEARETKTRRRSRTPLRSRVSPDVVNSQSMSAAPGGSGLSCQPIR